MNRLANSAQSGMCLMVALSVTCVVGCGGGGSGSTFSQNSNSQKGSHRGPAPVNLGEAGNYAILTKAGITTTGTTAITGNMGVSPIASTAMTGFGLVLSGSGQFSTSSLVTGQVYASNYSIPTPASLTTAIGDMQHAYTDAAGRTTPPPTSLPSEIGGLTLAPGLYKASTAVGISTNVTLNGGPNDVWIFQISKGLTQASGTRVNLTGGAVASNVFWQVAGVVAIGTTADMEGEVLGATGITMNTGAKANGRLLAQTSVTLIANAVTEK